MVPSRLSSKGYQRKVEPGEDIRNLPPKRLGVSVDVTIDRVIKAIRSVVETGQEINGHSLIREVAGWDSMAMVNTVLLFEEEFQVEIDIPQILEAESISDIVSVLKQCPGSQDPVW